MTTILGIKTPVIGRRRILAFLFIVGYAALVLGHYHDRFWQARGYGYFAHVAERILDGEVLHRDVQALHAGYVYFASALALRLFGDDLVSLKYPLVALGFLQSCLIFFLIAPRGTLPATAASVSLTSLSFVQYLNPTTHWYSLFLVIAIICALSWIPRQHRWRLELLGFLVITLALFRQLTGVIVAIGVLTYLLAEAPRAASGTDRKLARALIGFMFGGLAWYLITKSDAVGWLIFGIWPLAVLVLNFFTVAVANGAVLRLLIRFGLGGVIGVAPLMLYHVLNGSLASWFDDAVLAAVALTKFEFVRALSFGPFLILGMRQLIFFETISGVLNGLFWLILTLLPIVLGFLVLRRLRHGGKSGPVLHPLPFLAVFYAVVSVHTPSPGYLFFSTGLSLAAVLWLTAGGRSWRKHVPAVVACALSAIGLYYQAAQPYSRGLLGRFQGVRVEMVPSDGLDRVSLWITAASLAHYRHLVDLIQRETRPDETILAVPGSPEFYYLSRRKNPLRFSFLQFGILNDKELNATQKILERNPPKLVIYESKLPYNTIYILKLMDFIKQRYELLEKWSRYEIYRYPDE